MCVIATLIQSVGNVLLDISDDVTAGQILGNDAVCSKNHYGGDDDAYEQMPTE
jgi:hypothetical protein